MELQAKCRYTLADVIRIVFYQAPRMPVVPTVAVVAITIATWNAARAMSILDNPMPNRALAFIVTELAYLAIAALLLVAFLLLLSVTVYITGGQYGWRELRFTLSEDSLLVELPGKSLRYKWSSIKKVWQNRDYIFVSAGLYAGTWFVPKRCLGGSTDAGAFYSFITRTWIGQHPRA